MSQHLHNIKWSQFFWDAWCLLSIIGIWPRFLEPKILSVSKLDIKIEQLPNDLDGLKIVQFSDLHWNDKISPLFINRLRNKINALNPDLIVFTGDFICRSQLKNGEKLKTFLSSLKAKHGAYAIFGNHDYDRFVTLNSEGIYDIDCFHASAIKRGFKRLLFGIPVKGIISDAARKAHFHHELNSLLSNTPFKLLHNNTVKVPFKNSFINISGLGEYSLGKLNVQETFKNFDPSYPGVILVHHPDAIPLLKNAPGELILAGHTHGAQVNIPILKKRLTFMEHPQFIRGLKKFESKWVYTNRGVGSTMPFRWFSTPEITLITMKKGKHDA